MANGAVERMARLVDLKDAGTQAHSVRVSAMALRIARELGWSQDDCERIRVAGCCHDLGKIGIDEAILAKPDRLTEGEYRMIKTHPGIGAQIVESHGFDEEMIEWVLHHHERPDGRGYPDGLVAGQISTGAAILCLSDCWDVMVSERPYKKPMSVPDALSEVARCCGTQFLHHVVTALERVVYPLQTHVFDTGA